METFLTLPILSFFLDLDIRFQKFRKLRVLRHASLGFEMVFRYSTSGSKEPKGNAGRLDDEFETNRNVYINISFLLFVPDVWMKRPGTPERIHEPDFGWKITLTSTSAKLELKWLRSSKRKCLAKVKGMKGKGENERKEKDENERER
ncbi:unnamed protein product [Rhizophagus irregularis]|nr:unnamed protein product [Rhizophagus irregularis]